jgi:hypothetical protein
MGAPRRADVVHRRPPCGLLTPRAFLAPLGGALNDVRRKSTSPRAEALMLPQWAEWAAAVGEGTVALAHPATLT